jgi:transcriptional regulator with XRE-family HTH domain
MHTENIRRIRKSRKLTLKELSLSTGIDAGSLSRMERGLAEMKVGQFLAIARALGVSPADLIKGDAE